MLKHRGIRILVTVLIYYGLVQCVQAEDNFGRISLGVSGYWPQRQFKLGLGDHRIKPNKVQPDVFLGFKLNNYFSLEGGYRRGISGRKTVLLRDRELVFGVPLPGNNEVSSRFSLDSGYMNLVALMPLSEQYTIGLIGALGVAWVKFQMRADIKAVAQTTVRFQTHRWIPRAGLGIEAMLTESLGWRCMGFWDKHSMIKHLKRADIPTSPMRVTLQNSISFGVGAVYHFD